MSKEEGSNAGDKVGHCGHCDFMIEVQVDGEEVDGDEDVHNGDGDTLPG